jgi:iron complex transport system ATP-binding protein
MLTAEKLELGYGKLPAVIHDASLHLGEGELMVLIGPNGSGKSTILRALAAALRPRAGTVYLDGKSIHRLSPKALAQQMAFLPQSPLVPDDFTVRDLVGYGRNPHLKWNGCMSPRDWAIVDEAIERTRLAAFQHRRISSLSGGERQRAWLALALAQKPKILLLDEPTTFLDICYQFELLELVKELNQTLAISTVMVLHDLNQASRYAHTIHAVHQGRIVATGPPEQVITSELLAEIFKIRVRILTDTFHRCPYLIPMESLQHKPTESTTR